MLRLYLFASWRWIHSWTSLMSLMMFFLLSSPFTFSTPHPRSQIRLNGPDLFAKRSVLKNILRFISLESIRFTQNKSQKFQKQDQKIANVQMLTCLFFDYLQASEAEAFEIWMFLEGKKGKFLLIADFFRSFRRKPLEDCYLNVKNKS